MIVKAPKLRCARCDTRLANPATCVFSKHTRAHFCADIDGCARRAARKTKKTAASALVWAAVAVVAGTGWHL